MNELEQQQHAVEISIQEAQEQIDRSERLRRLEKNKDFKFLILEGLLRDDAVRQVMLKGAPQLHAPGPGAETALNGINARMAMISELNNYFRYLHIEGASAKAALSEHENAHDELLKEQLGGV